MISRQGVNQADYDSMVKARDRAEKEAAKHAADARESNAVAEEGALLLQWKDRELDKFKKESERYKEIAKANGLERDQKQVPNVELL